MKEIKLPELPELTVRSVYYDGYHAKVAFSKIKTNHVNYKILKAIEMHPSYTRDQINTEVDGIERHRPGYRSVIFTRMLADNLYHYCRENRQYHLTDLGRDLLRFAEENS